MRSYTHFSHADHSNELYVSEVTRISKIAISVTIGLVIIEIMAGIYGNSQAVVADAIHSLSDSVVDVAILFGVRFWTKPPDVDHPHGHWRIESLFTIFIGLLLALAALGLGYRALLTFADSSRLPPGKVALLAALVAIFAQEILYRWTFSVGSRIGSAALIADAWHHRSDSLSSIPAAISVAGAIFIPGASFLDGFGALVVAGIILHASFKIMRPAADQLIDTAAPEERVKKIEQLALAEKGVREVHAVRTRRIGPGLEVDLHICVDGSLTVLEGHEISEDVRRRLIEEGPSVIDVLVHLDPEKENSSQEQGSDQI